MTSPGSQVADEGRLLRLALVMVGEFMAELPADVDPPPGWLEWCAATLATVGAEAAADATHADGPAAMVPELEAIERRAHERAAAAAYAVADLADRTARRATGDRRRKAGKSRRRRSPVA